MHFLTVLVCVVAAAAAGGVHGRPDSSYTTKYDGVNVRDVLGNARLLDAYVKCALGQGKCSAEGRELKSHIQEALESNCSRCSEKQRENTRVVIAHLINKEPDYWRQLSAKYDPKNQYVTKYESELRDTSL